jgi:hypothetical protein
MKSAGHKPKGKPKPAPKPVGRPTDYDPAFCDRVEDLGKEGYSKAEIAAELGKCRKTLDNWAAEHPDFLHALNRAKDFELAWWERQAREGLAKPGFNAAIWSKSVNGRFPAEPYRERHEVSGPNGAPIPVESKIDVSGLSTDQLRALASIKVPAE